MFWISLAMFVFGMVVLSSGKLALSDTKKVTGTPARICGLICAVPLVLDLIELLLLRDMKIVRKLGMAAYISIKAGIVGLILVVMIVLTVRAYRAQKKKEEAEIDEMSRLLAEESTAPDFEPVPAPPPPPPPLPEHGDE